MHGVQVGKEMGVNTWAAFAGTDGQAVVDGDFAMLADEMQRVLKTMRAGGINIVAIHQHMIHDQPALPVHALLGQGNCARSWQRPSKRRWIYKLACFNNIAEHQLYG
jgi:hypothetical protein